MFYRIKQFFWALFAQVSHEEEAFIAHYLSEKEEQLFKELSVYEQKHSVRVAYEMEKEAQRQGGKIEEYIRVGLLHDIGKSKYPLNPIEKSIIVVLDGLTKGKIKKMNHLKMVKCYYHHGAISYELLKASGKYSPLFLEAVKDHHQQRETSNQLLIALRQCDDRS